MATLLSRTLPFKIVADTGTRKRWLPVSSRVTEVRLNILFWGSAGLYPRVMAIVTAPAYTGGLGAMPQMGPGSGVRRRRFPEAESNFKLSEQYCAQRFNYLTFWCFHIFHPLLFTCTYAAIVKHISGGITNLFIGVMFWRLYHSCLGLSVVLGLSTPLIAPPCCPLIAPADVNPCNFCIC